MNRLYSILVMSTLIFSCNSSTIKDQWAGEIAMDGNDSDWERMDQTILEDQHIVISVANDSNNLYLMFRGNDENMDRRIRMMGVCVYLNEDGKKTKDYGLCYTGSTDMHISYRPEHRPAGDRPESGSERMETFRDRFRKNLPKPGMVMIIRGEQREEVVESNLSGPSAGSSYRDGVFFYEFKMPLPLRAELGKKVTVGLELGGISNEDRMAMRENMENGARRPDGGMKGGRPGGMGGRPGGMRGGEGRPPRADFEKQEVWLTLSLAGK